MTRSPTIKRKKKRQDPFQLSMTALSTALTAILTLPESDVPRWIRYACAVGVLVVQKLIASTREYTK